MRGGGGGGGERSRLVGGGGGAAGAARATPVAVTSYGARRQAAGAAAEEEDREARLAEDETDPVCDALAKASRAVAAGLCCWALGLLVLMLWLGDAQLLPLRQGYLVVAVPSWVGSAVILCALVTLLVRTKAVKVVSRNDQILFRAHEGWEARKRYTSVESCPLINRTLFWGVFALLLDVLILTAQILFYMWLLHHTPSIWACVAPLLILLILLISTTMLIRTFSLLTPLVFALLFAAVIVVAHQASAPGASVDSLRWDHILFPVVMAQFVCLFSGVYVLSNHCLGWYWLSRRQIACLTCYMLAGILALWGEVYFVAKKMHLEDDGDDDAAGQDDDPNANAGDDPESVQNERLDETLSELLPPLMACIALLLFLGAAISTLRAETRRLVKNKGYSTPLPLSRTQAGWVPAAGDVVFFELLGHLRRRIRHVNRRRKHGHHRHAAPAPAPAPAPTGSSSSNRTTTAGGSVSAGGSFLSVNAYTAVPDRPQE